MCTLRKIVDCKRPLLGRFSLRLTFLLGFLSILAGGQYACANEVPPPGKVIATTKSDHGNRPSSLVRCLTSTRGGTKPTIGSRSFQQSPQGETAWISAFLNIAETIPDKVAARAIRRVRRDPATYRFQLLLGVVTEHEDGELSTLHHEYRVDHDYLYPASAIKLYASIGALVEWTRRLKEYPWLSIDSPLAIGSGALPKRERANVVQGYQTLQHIIRKTQIVSSNSGFNQVLDVVSIQSLGTLMDELFPSVRVFHHLFGSLPPSEFIRPAPIIRVLNDDGSRGARTLRGRSQAIDQSSQPIEASCEGKYNGFGQQYDTFLIGDAHLDRRGVELIKKPMDFQVKNRSSLYDFQRAISAINEVPVGTLLQPNVDLKDRIRTDWFLALRRATVDRPSQSQNPKFDGPGYTDHRFKAMLPGLEKSGIAADDIFYSNKGGAAYGFVVENAFLKLSKRKRSRPRRSCAGMLVSFGVYANENRTLNDNKYEYLSISKPVFRAIGYAVGRLLQQGHCDPR